MTNEEQPTMTIKIVSRWDPTKVLVALEAESLWDADLRGANLAGADLAGADLARADLRGADLAGAYLARANLGDAGLAGANLRDADLRGANLAGADLAGATCGGFTLHAYVGTCNRVTDPYAFLAFSLQGSAAILVRAGCRTMTTEDYREHIEREYPATRKATETYACLDYIERMAAIAIGNMAGAEK